MGNDFKRKTAPSFQRGRREQVDQLKTPELPTKVVEKSRTFVVLPVADIDVSEKYDIVKDGLSLQVIKDGKIFAHTQTAPASIVEDVGKAGGRVPGSIVRYYGPNMPCRVSVELAKSAP